MTKNKIYVFTATFPFGKHETFLENELNILSKDLDITVIPLYQKKGDKLRNLDFSIKFFNPIIPNNKFIQITRILINNRFLLLELKEFFRMIKCRQFSLKNIKSYCIAIREVRIFGNSKTLKKIKNDSSTEAVYFYWSSSIVLIAPYLNKKVYIRTHGGEINDEYYGYIPFLKEKVSLNAIYLPISQWCENSLKRINPSIKTIISRIGTYSKVDNLTSKIKIKDEKLIISCSSIIPIKRVHLIVEVLKNCKTHIKWVHFGDGSEMKSIIKLAEKELNSNVKFELKGRLNNKEIFIFYQNNYVDLFINLSASEGVPVSIMEAQSFGIPCLATDVGAVNEIVNDINGLLVAPNFTPKAVAHFIDHINENELKNKRHFSRKEWEELYNGEKNFSQLSQILGATSNLKD